MNSRFKLITATATFLVGILGVLAVVDSFARAESSGPTIAAMAVNTVDDELNSDGDCSLREAITAANANTATDACPAGDGVITDTITFAVSGTITVTTQLDVTAGGPLVINGGGAITISGGGSVRVLYVNSGVDFILEGLTLVDGYANDGGGIYNLGTLVVSDSTLSSNSACHGGGIYNQGTLTITDSILSDNSAGSLGCSGGGIYNYWGTVSLRNSTLAHNGAREAAGIYNVNGTLTVLNSTLYDNHATMGSGGGIKSSGVLDITNSTLSGNSGDLGGGVYALGVFRMRNTILANNSSTYHGPDCSGGVESMGHNLVGDKEDCYFIPSTGDLIGVDPKLGPLQDNGGPTHTQALLPRSLAIGGGNPDGCKDAAGNPLTTDQRGFPRSGRCDIGAYEWQPEISGPYAVYLPYISGACPTKLFSDDFSNPKSGWPVGESQNARYEYLNDEYRILVKSKNLWVSAGTGFKASDYVAVVDARNATGVDGSYGLVFGRSDDGKQFYTFEIDSSGGYAIWRYYDSNNWVLLAEGLSGSIYPGTVTNQLKIERSGSQIWAYANGELLNIINDGNYTGLRGVGLSATSGSQPNVDARFDNFTLYPITCGASSASLSKEGGMLEVQGMDAPWGAAHLAPP